MISVIIPSRNRAELLAYALESLTKQTLSNDEFEVLVIDNGSTDDTATTVQQFSEKLPNLRYFYEPEPGLHSGRHLGMLKSQGAILVFADDDIEAFPTWLASIQGAFLESDVAMVGGNNLPMFLNAPPLWLNNMWERSSIQNGRAFPWLSILELTGEKRELSPYLVWGCNFSIRKPILLAAGGFHPDGMPKELIRFRGDGETHVSRFVDQSDMKCIFHPGASVFHKVTPERMTIEYFRQRGFNQGVSDSYSALRGEVTITQKKDRNSLVNFVAYGRHSIKRIIEFLQPRDSHEQRVLKELKLGYQEGYAYHQKMYLEDTEVRAWVHKPQYFHGKTI